MLSAILTLYLLGLLSIRKVALWQVVQKNNNKTLVALQRILKCRFLKISTLGMIQPLVCRETMFPNWLAVVPGCRWIKSVAQKVVDQKRPSRCFGCKHVAKVSCSMFVCKCTQTNRGCTNCKHLIQTSNGEALPPK